MYEFSFRSASQHCTNDKMAYPWQNYNNKRNVDKQEVSLLKHVFFPTKSFIPADNFRQQAAHCCRKCVELFVRKVETLRIKGPFTHAIFDAISDAISPTKRALPARMSFSRSIAWLGKKVMTYYLKTPFFPIPANLAAFRRSDTRLKTRAG